MATASFNTIPLPYQLCKYTQGNPFPHPGLSGVGWIKFMTNFVILPFSNLGILTPKLLITFGYKCRGLGSCCNDHSGRDKIYSSSSSSNGSCLSSNYATWDDDSTTQMIDQCGYLYYQYNEMASPYDRVPLQEKMNELGKHYPGLLDLRSTDVSPYSWMAIAWYPVYQIPVARNVKELSACFFTYHPLSSLSQGSKNMMLEKEKVQGTSCPGEGRRSGSREEEISLPAFAVVTYKMFGTLWINPETSDQDTIICQQTAACYWLRQLQFQHHDFNFFMSPQFLNY